jgi:hypothetical protein
MSTRNPPKSIMLNDDRYTYSEDKVYCIQFACFETYFQDELLKPLLIVLQ